MQIRLLGREEYEITNRSLAFIQKNLYTRFHFIKKLNPKELREKTVLDVGCGLSSLTKELREKGVNAYSIDMHDSKPPNKGTHVRGFAEKMPFKNRLFDFVYSTWSLFSYIEDRDIKRNALKEICRVLKPGGKLRMSIVNLRGIEKLLKETNIPMKITNHFKPKYNFNSITLEKEHFVEIEKLK